MRRPSARRFVRPRAAACGLLILTLAGAVGAGQRGRGRPARAAEPALERRWFYLNASGHAASEERVAADLALFERAARAGYNGVLFEELYLGMLDRVPAAYHENVKRLVEAARSAGLEVVPQVIVPHGGRVLGHNPNLAEALPVRDAAFVVRGGRLQLQPDQPEVAGGRARVIPHRLYRLRAQSAVKVTDPSGHRLAYPQPGATEALFNSEGNREVRVEGAGALVQEEGPVNIVRRDGAPLRVEGEGGRVLREGVDFEPLVDPLVEAVRKANVRYDATHAAPEIRLKEGAGLREGDRARVSYYHAALNFKDGLYQAYACLSEPELYQLWARQFEQAQALCRAKGTLIGHDEIRAANSCAACARERRTAGRAVADSFRRAVEIVRRVTPDATIYAWSDMFDPHENAVPRYFFVQGPLAGAWDGLPREAVVLNWSDQPESFDWFAGRGNRQVIAGYYDGEEPKMERWLPQARQRLRRRNRDVDGVMYTTWKNDYSQLESFAATCWGR